MIKKAKVSLSAVSAFKDIVVDAKVFAPRFESAVHILHELHKSIEEQVGSLEDTIEKLIEARQTVEKRIQELEQKLAKLLAALERLQTQLEAVEAEIASTPESYTSTDENGETHEYPNPAYIALCSKAASIESEISGIECQIGDVQRQLDHATAVASRIDSHTERINGIIFSLREKQNDCQKLISEVDDINAANNRQTTLAYDLLCKIEGIIHEYINIKMKMESSIAYKDVQDVSAEGLIGISINITVKQVINNIAASENNGHAQREIDDNGKQYRVGDELIRNNKFQINGYEYETDNQGRTIVASGKLSINELGQKNRSMDDNMDVIAKGDQQENDDRGHLIGHQFNGSDRMENLVPQDWRINRRSFRELEDSLASLVKTGHEIKVSVIPFYGDDTRRPAGIFYFYNIDGVSNIVLFPNNITEEEQ